MLEVNELEQPLRFQGQYHDLETNLYYNRNRYYSPEIGRYITLDPIKLAGGLNSYQYTKDPINWIDPLGLNNECPGLNSNKSTVPEEKASVNTKEPSLPETVDLTEHRKDHILNRHASGASQPDKTEFPASWDNDKILHNVSDVATDPNSITGTGKWDSPYAIGMREGIEIRVDFYPNNHPTYSGKISTAYPTNVPPNPPKPPTIKP